MRGTGDTETMPLLSIQELRTVDAPKIYRPHTTTKPAPFDWDAITPTCTSCSTKSGQVNTTTRLCPTCDPNHQTTPSPTPRPAKTPSRIRVPFDTDAAVEAYEGGQLIAEIADALGVETYRIRNTLQYRGIQLRDDRARRFADRPRTQRRRRTTPTGAAAPNTRNPINEAALVAEYLQGATAPELANAYGIGPKRARDIVARHGHPLRDDRRTRSGGKPKEYDPELIDQIRHLYLDEHLSQSAVAIRLGLTAKVVQTIMNRHQITARQGETGHSDGAKNLKAQIAALGVPTLDIKTWALAAGLVTHISRGLPSQRVVDAYQAAHQPTDERQTA